MTAYTCGSGTESDKFVLMGSLLLVRMRMCRMAGVQWCWGAIAMVSAAAAVSVAALGGFRVGGSSGDSSGSSCSRRRGTEYGWGSTAMRVGRKNKTEPECVHNMWHD